MDDRHPIVCPKCGGTFHRTRKQVAVVVRRSGQWVCRSCPTAERNAARAFPIGSTRTTTKGYVEIKTAGGWMRRNRHVMEQHLGRKLRPEEDVHHLNGVRDDDRIENLEVVDHVEHMLRHHRGAKRGQRALSNIRAAIPRKATTKLNQALAASVRLRSAAKESQRSIAKDLKVSPMTVNRIVNGKAWTSTNARPVGLGRTTHVLQDNTEN